MIASSRCRGVRSETGMSELSLTTVTFLAFRLLRPRANAHHPPNGSPSHIGNP